MSEQNPEQPARDEGDENPDLMVGDPVEAEHDLDLDSFDDEEESGDE
jgi:hypothetical protein